MLLCAGCNNERVSVQPTNKYVYIDINGCMHYSLDCIRLAVSSDSATNYIVKRIRIYDLTDSMFDRTCSNCINDSIYEQLRAKSKHSGKKQIKGF